MFKKKKKKKKKEKIQINDKSSAMCIDTSYS